MNTVVEEDTNQSVASIKESYSKWLESPAGGSVKAHLVKRRLLTLQRFIDYTLPNKPIHTGVEEHLMDGLKESKIVHEFFEVERTNRKLGPSGLMDAGIYLREYLHHVKYLMSGSAESFSATESLLERFIKGCSREKKKLETGSNNLELLIANKKWCTLADLQKVIPHHLPKYTQILKQSKAMTLFIKGDDLTFATGFIATYLFLKVKGTRPASYEHLTVSMIEDARKNGGIIDQSKFKTEKIFLFDCMQLNENDFAMLDQYTTYIRPLLNPKCDNLLINSRNGQVLKHIGKCMTKLVYEAIGVSITPTIYRKIIETECDDNLDEADKIAMSEDQKHASGTANRHYRLRRARNAAKKAKLCMAKLLGNSVKYVDGCVSQHLTSTCSKRQTRASTKKNDC
jgi:hypothetical protein